MDDASVNRSEYMLVTLHRAENVDSPERLAEIFRAFELIAERFDKDILISVHPRTAARLEEYGVKPATPRIRLLQPLGFFDFVNLEKNALVVLTDSGTVQEECAIFRVPNVTIRDVTERPETIECGSNILSGADPDSIVRAAELAISQPSDWNPPLEYGAENVAQVVSKILIGYTNLRRHVS
jgi:UDP-N-acetylglucosamine 2-epimerase (non-hydrolysing)